MITMAIPRHLLLNSNQRLHWAAKADKTKALRWRGKAAALSVAERYDRAHLTVHVHWPDNRRRDEQNLAPTTKAIIDGFVDACLQPDDNGDHLIGPDYRRGMKIPGDHAVILTFKFEAIA